MPFFDLSLFSCKQKTADELRISDWSSDVCSSDLWAADPMPPNATNMFVRLKPRKVWPNPGLPKEELVSRIEGNLAKIPGNAYEITQPIQMRFNELIAGVRGDIAVKVFGDDFNQMYRTAEQIAAALRKTQGAADVKVEQTTGLPMLDIREIGRAHV